MPLNVFGRRRNRATATASPAQKVHNDMPESTSIVRGLILLEELKDAVSRIDCLVQQSNIAWSVENGSYLTGSPRRIQSATSPSKNPVCKVMPFDGDDEAEMVELLRRVSELVVQGEQLSNNEPESEQIFHYFYEQNVLGKIVDILTGISFLPNDGNSFTMLPPLSIATQAVQSVAIIVLNVTKDTSLYLLLANDRLNDLIDLPFHKYSSFVGSNDAELNELSTNFVSFLKSLAMRINSATLQFFLTFPGEKADRITSSSPHFTSNKIELPTFTVPEVSFPLYARALQFCTADQETFVRTTAMNICLNILRLASLPSIPSSCDSSDPMCNDMTLTLRDRIIISTHVCSQDKVLALITPISSKIVQLCGWLEDSISSFHAFAGYTGMPQLRRKIRDIVLDLQEEFVLLDDVFKVGMASLNEQAIEILMATAIYPILLQPLLYQKAKKENEDAEVDIKSETSKTSNTTVNPFHSGEVSISLLSSGLLGNSSTHSIETNAILSIPAKTSIIALVTFLDSVTHPVLVRLVACCLFHPLSAESSDNAVAVPIPSVLVTDSDGLAIRLDPTTKEDFDLYSFGRRMFDDNNDDFLSSLSCLYVLTPAIADLLDRNYSRIMVCKNRYRDVIMNGLHGLYHNEGTQQFFALLLHVSIVRLGKDFDQIAFSNIDPEIDSLRKDCHIRKDENSPENFFDTFHSTKEERKSDVNESFRFERLNTVPKVLTSTIEALCNSVVTAPLRIGGVWKLFFDDVACNTLIQLCERSRDIRGYASSVLKRRVQLSAAYVENTCYSYISENILDRSNIDRDLDDSVDYFIDNIIGDENDGLGTLLEFITYDSDGLFPQFSLPITNNAVIDRAISLASGDFFIPKELAESFEGDRRALLCIMTNFLSFMQSDALLNFLDPNGDYCEGAEANIPNASSVVPFNATILQDKHSYRLSPSFCEVLYYDRGSIDPASHHKEGAVVSFVGKTALPCVCEVTNYGDNTLKKADSFIETNGIRWQSLYMVLLSNLMVLVIPSKSRKGNGRIVTSCRLSGLSIEKDDATTDSDPVSNPARRVILSFGSLDHKVPGLFTKISPSGGQTLHHSYLELWFEKQSLADLAYDSLNKAVRKAKIRRGKKLREHLTRIASM